MFHSVLVTRLSVAWQPRRTGFRRTRGSKVLCTLGLLLVAGLMSSPAVLGQTEGDPSGPVELLFVQTADDLEVDSAASTLRLVNVATQTLYFSDRPYRIAGHLKMAEFLDEWTEKAGTDNLAADPPNATLSVYEPGQPDSTLVVVEISHPVVDKRDLVYTYKLIEGTMPTGGGETALFIDKVGVGGGVGVGYHGVGVGRRGPGA